MYADNLSQAAILKGIRSGRAFIDLQNIPGRMLDVSATSGDSRAEMGGVLSLPCGGPIAVDIHVVGLLGSRIDLVVDGHSGGQGPDIARADETISLPIPDRSYARWFRIDVRGPSGARAIIGNPIYVHGPIEKGASSACLVRAADRTR